LGGEKGQLETDIETLKRRVTALAKEEKDMEQMVSQNPSFGGGQGQGFACLLLGACIRGA